MDVYKENSIGEIQTIDGVEMLVIDESNLSPEQRKVVEQHKLN